MIMIVFKMLAPRKYITHGFERSDRWANTKQLSRLPMIPEIIMISDMYIVTCPDMYWSVAMYESVSLAVDILQVEVSLRLKEEEYVNW
jgi:hypothetical protein